MSAHIKQSANIVAQEIEKFLELSKPCFDEDYEYQKIEQAKQLQKIVYDLGEMVGHLVDAIDLQGKAEGLNKDMKYKIDDFTFEDECKDIIFYAKLALEEAEPITTTDYEEHSTWGMGFDRHNQK